MNRLYNLIEINPGCRSDLAFQPPKWTGLLMLFSVFGLLSCAQTSTQLMVSGANHAHPHGGLQVAAAFGPDGKLWRATPDKQHIYVDYSTDQGKTFAAPVIINPESQRIKTSGENHPGIAVDHAGNVYVIYPAEGEKQPAMLYFSISAGGTGHFTPPAPISGKTEEANIYQGKLISDADGQAYVFWHDERDRTDWKQAGNSIYSTVLDAHSSSGITSVKVADTLCDCCRIAAAFDGNQQPILLARFIYPGSIRDHGLILMQKNGMPPLLRRATVDQWNIEACPEHGPALAIGADNRIHIAWFTQGSVRQGLFYAYSDDQGEHFSQPLHFGNPERLPSHPDILAQGKHIFLAWTEYNGAKTQLQVMQSSDGGQSWSAAKQVAEAANEADYPFLLSNQQGVFVSWNSKTEGYRLIPLN